MWERVIERELISTPTHTHTHPHNHKHTPTHPPTPQTVYQHLPAHHFLSNWVFGGGGGGVSFSSSPLTKLKEMLGFCQATFVGPYGIKRSVLAACVAELGTLFKKPTPSTINLLKNAKNNFLKLKNLKNTESAQLCWSVVGR